MTPTINLADATLERLAKGDGILFLGSGASRVASGPGGLKGLSGNELRDLLCDRFLGGMKKDRQLAYVGDLVKSEVGILDMQRYVSSLFRGLTPTPAHLLIPKFKWKAIFTTNYDLLVEMAYDASAFRVQNLGRIICDDDDFQAVLKDPKGLPFLKLHGCVTRDSDTRLPLILSSWEYYKFRERRTRLFGYLKEWGHDFPIVFCGYEIADENVRDILFDLTDPTISRPRYVFISPSIQAIDIRMWSERRVDASAGTFDNLMSHLDHQIDALRKTLAFARPKAAAPITRFIPSHNQPSVALLRYIKEELQLVYKGMPTEHTVATDFYQGLSDSWGWLPSEFDIPRVITDELIFEWNESRKPTASVTSLILLQGYAGSGKSVVLRRAAWNVAHFDDTPVFFLCDGGTLRIDEIHELFDLLGEQVTIFVDDLVAYAGEVRSLLRHARKQSLNICIIGAARTNEWNVEGGSLVPQVTKELELLDLSDSEIRLLIEKLRNHRSLGYLENLNRDEAFIYFKKSLEHQLLVGLHQVTFGPDLEEILLREYTNIVPRIAQTLYLDICTLHRFGVPVRAGLISRVTGVSFEDFRDRLLKPLQHVVRVTHYAKAADYVYRTRHQDIAEIVFRKVLPDPLAKSEQLVRIVSCLNVSYTTDRSAMIELLRSRSLVESFPDKAMGYRILDAARLSGLDEETVDQYRALFELHHPAGDIRAASSAIERAIAAAEHKPNRATLHVKALVLRKLANLFGISDVEKQKRRHEAAVILNKLMADKHDPHPFHVKVELLLDELAEKLEDSGIEGDEATGREVADLVREAESTLQQALQLFPANAYLAATASRLASLLENHPKAIVILELAFKRNQQNAFIAIRLARQHSKQNNRGAAISVLRKTLTLNSTNKDIHYTLAQELRADGEHKNQEEIGQHLRKSFTDGDNRYDARFFFSRHQYIFGDRALARREFSLLARLPLAPTELNQVRALVKDINGEPVIYTGKVTSRREGYCFVRCEDLVDDIFVHASEFDRATWTLTKVDSALNFKVGFCFRGARGVNATARRP